MIDINFIKEYPEKFSKLMQQRNASISIENILKLDKEKSLKYLNYRNFRLKETLYQNL